MEATLRNVFAELGKEALVLSLGLENLNTDVTWVPLQIIRELVVNHVRVLLLPVVVSYAFGCFGKESHTYLHVFIWIMYVGVKYSYPQLVYKWDQLCKLLKIFHVYVLCIIIMMIL